MWSCSACYSRESWGGAQRAPVGCVVVIVLGGGVVSGHCVPRRVSRFIIVEYQRSIASSLFYHCVIVSSCTVCSVASLFSHHGVIVSVCAVCGVPS